MTLVAVFVRNVPKRRSRRELVFASDSCLSGGQRFKQAAKIFALPRSDALFCFAGMSYYAYPFAIQLATSIGSYMRNADRRFPLLKTVEHASEIFGQSLQLITNTPSDGHPVDADASFLFGGYSWHDERFRIWRIGIDRQGRMCPLQEVTKPYAFIGTVEAIPEAEKRLEALLTARGKTDAHMDMEPFEVLRDLIAEERYSDIAGTPQVAKVFQYMDTQFFATLWKCTDGKIRPHVFGRPLFDWEETSWPVFDPYTMHFKAERPPNWPEHNA